MVYTIINIEATLAKAVEHLGYEQVSLKQHEAIMHFVAAANMSLYHSDCGTCMSLCYLLLPIVLITFDKRM